MTETNKLKVNKLADSHEVPTNQQQQEVEKQLITLKGFTTSRVEQALKGSKTQGQSPYPARVFLKVDNQEQDIPVIFRINEEILCPHHKKWGNDGKYRNACPWYCHGKLGDWTKPKIKKGSYLQVQGHFDNPIKNQRPSFTATSYQILEEDYLAKKAILDQAKNKLPEFEQAYQQIKATREYLESHDRRLYTFKK